MDSLIEVAQEFARLHPIEFAKLVETAEMNEGCELLSSLKRDVAASVLSQMSPSAGALIIEKMDSTISAEVLKQMMPTYGANLMRKFDKAKVVEVLSNFSSDLRSLYERQLKQPKGTVGAIMDPAALCLPEDILVSEAWEIFQKHPTYALYYLYVVDRSQRLVGVINIRELAIASKSSQLGTVMHRQVVSIPAGTDIKTLIRHPQWSRLHAMPVVDAQDKFLGVVRYETIREADNENLGNRFDVAGEIGTALGEVYWLGLSGFVEGLASSVRKKSNSGDK